MTDVTRNATAPSERAGSQRTAASCAEPVGGCAGSPGEGGVLIADRQSDVRLDSERYRALVRDVLDAEGVPPGSETAVTFVGSEEMAQLNKAHMGHTGPTDVLAFPIDLVAGTHASSAPDAGDVLVGNVLVGDVVVCPAVAASNAAAGAGSRPGHDGSVTAEIDLLVVHGVLHLLGMDHVEPAAAAAMRARETEHLRRLWSRS
ncbi:rRNA maturation RNase YbeY [Candidatus Poriferisodalis sp.]|uniref:rRNA maturation RNase YbeY n=1 Tax=Candidatus Poriferisodalis sp. TaxID=3101277 RepID=UPI003B59B6C1